MIDVTVIGVSYNTAGHMERALASVARSARRLSVQYVVVDNGSADDSVERLRALDDPVVEVVELGENTGFSHGVNVGLARAEGRLVLLCNPDVLLAGDDLARLVDVLDSRPDAWAVTPWFVNPDGTDQWFWRRLPGPLRFPLTYLRWGKWLDRRLGRPVYRWRSYRDLGSRPEGALEIDAVGAACLLARRDDLLSAGGLDERYFNFFSDTHLVRERRARGRVLLGCGSVSVVHERGITFRNRERWEREAEFLGALASYVDGEGPVARAMMKASLAIELGLPHPKRRQRRAVVRSRA